jgi:hypothetical protein
MAELGGSLPGIPWGTAEGGASPPDRTIFFGTRGGALPTVPAMRALQNLVTLAFVLVFGLMSLPTRAEDLVFVSSDPHASEYAAALELAVRGYGVSVVIQAMPDAQAPLARAAAAQSAMREGMAAGALWVEPEAPARVRALGSRSDEVFEAPLPAPLDILRPSVFGSVAASVVVEALGRAERPAVEAAAWQPEPAQAAPDQTLTAAPSNPPATQTARRKRPEPARPFFLRAGLAYGLAYVRNGMAADSAPPASLLTLESLAQARAKLASGGYKCRLKLANSMISADDCSVLVDEPGFVASPAFDFALGMNLVPRLALALTARVALESSHGVLSKLVLGGQGEVLLTQPRLTGLWFAAVGGAGLGRVQVGLPGLQGQSDSPYVTSGLGNLRLGGLLGYRFHPHVGVVLATLLHVMFPEPLFMIDPSLSLEVRL